MSLTSIGDKVVPRVSKIGCRLSDGSFSDVKLHEGLMAGVDDTHLREMSALRAIATLGLSREEAEHVFDVKLPLPLEKKI